MPVLRKQFVSGEHGEFVWRPSALNYLESNQPHSLNIWICCAVMSVWNNDNNKRHGNGSKWMKRSRSRYWQPETATAQRRHRGELLVSWWAVTDSAVSGWMSPALVWFKWEPTHTWQITAWHRTREEKAAWKKTKNKNNKSNIRNLNKNSDIRDIHLEK